MKAPMVALMTTALVTLALALAPRAALAATPTESVEAVLAEPGYAFCHDERFPLTAEERAYCPLIRASACPSFARACAVEAPASKTTPREEPRARSSPSSISVPSGLSGLSTMVFVALLAAACVALGMAVRRNRGLAADEPAPEPETRRPDAPSTASDAVTAGDPRRLLASARAAAARGDHARAVTEAYAALLRHLDGAGLVELRPSSTNGDYLRALRGRGELRQQFQSIVRDVERVQFGRTEAAAVWATLLARIAPVVERAALAMVVVALSLAASGCNARRGASARGPLGHQALTRVLEHQGLRASKRLTSLETLEGSVATLVLLGDAQIDDEAWRTVGTWVHDRGGTLILAGVSDAPADLAAEPETDREQASALTVAPAWTKTFGAPRLALPPGDRLALSLRDGTLLERGGSVYATLRDHGEGRVVVLADDRLFTNASLATAENADFVVKLLSDAGGEIQIADAFGGGAKNPVESLARAHLLPALLQTLALAVLFVLAAGAAFGKRRDRVTATRRAFVEHVRAVGSTYARAGAARHALGVYATWAIERLRARHRSGGGLSRLAEQVAARTGRDEREVLTILVEAHGAREPESPASRRQAVAAAPRHLDILRALVELGRSADQARPARGGRSKPPSPGITPHVVTTPTESRQR